MTATVAKLDNLPNELQLTILRYLSIRDRCYSFSNLNDRFNSLLKRLTPPIQLEDLPDELQLILFRRYFTLASLRSLFFGLNSRYDTLLIKLLPKTLRFSLDSYSFKYSSDYVKLDSHYTVYYLLPSISRWPEIYWHLLNENQLSESEPSKLTQIIVKYPITLNPYYFIMYYPHATPNQWIEADYLIISYSFYRSAGKGRNKISTDDLERKYPEKYNLMKDYPVNSPEYYKMFFDNEKKNTTKKLKEIHQQTQHIWKELREMID